MSRPFRLHPDAISEDDVEAGCKTILQLHQYWVIRLHAGVFQTMDGRRHIRGVPKGTPDYACMHGRFRSFLLEVKRPGAKLSPEQELQITVLKRQWDLPIVVVESVDKLCNFLAIHERSP